MKNIGYGQGYKYAHNFDDKVTDMSCLPTNLAGRTYYKAHRPGLSNSASASASTKFVR